MELSIIVPVYNTDEQKLYRCFESINKINEVEFECLIIDDGSKTKVGEFCQKYSLENNRFRYIYKENGGVSSARNVGLEQALGDTIAFVDSDDEICTRNIRKYLNNEQELVFTDIVMVDNNKEHIWKAFEQREGEIKVEYVLQKMTVTGIINGPYGKFIKNKFIQNNNFRFDENMVTGEDAVFLIRMLKKNPSMYYYVESSYKYYKEDTTSKQRMLKYTDICVENNLTIYKEMLDAIEHQVEQINDANHLISLATERYVKQIFNMAAELLLLGKFDERLQSVFEKKYLDIDQNIFSQCDSKTKFRLNVIVKKKWHLLYFIAKLRYIYLVMKR